MVFTLSVLDRVLCLYVTIIALNYSIYLDLISRLR
jgi:hypothetical protein